METEGETLLCAAVLVTGDLLLDSSDTESEHEIDEEPEAYECEAVLVAGSMMMNEVEQAKRKWSEDWLLRRNEIGSYATLNQELKLEQKLFCKYIRMSANFSLYFGFYNPSNSEEGQPFKTINICRSSPRSNFALFSKWSAIFSLAI